MLWTCDQVDVLYYDLLGSLKLVLLNCQNLPAKQALKVAIVEILTTNKSFELFVDLSEIEPIKI